MERSQHPRHIRSFVLRQGRLSAAQERAIQGGMPRWGVPFQAAPLDLDTVFGRKAARVLEIGFGMGTATVAIAEADPDRDFLGVEVHSPGIGALLKLIEEKGLRNVRVVQHDAVEVVRDMLPPASLRGVHVFFPDPWPKTRHHKRRLLQAEFVALLASRLEPGGYLHVATDWQDYAQHILEVLSAEKGLRNRHAGFAPRPDHRPLTGFELKGLGKGHGVWDVLFERPAK